MKLSEKGYLKIGNSIVGWVENGILKVTFDADKLEFNQADFKDCVVLTVEEAKEIIGTYIGTNCEIVKQHGIPELKIKNPNWLIHLLERIEQMEGK